MFETGYSDKSLVVKHGTYEEAVAWMSNQFDTDPKGFEADYYYMTGDEYPPDDYVPGEIVVIFTNCRCAKVIENKGQSLIVEYDGKQVEVSDFDIYPYFDW